jgi:peroxiredoxin
MPPLAPQLASVYTNFASVAPAAVKSTIDAAITDAITKLPDASGVIKPGATFPSFTLPSATKTPTSLNELLEKSTKGVLITFYRGGWCPFCNLALHSLQSILPSLTASGVSLIAISPELPDFSLSTSEKNALDFTVLSDVGNKLARELGIVWKQPSAMQGVMKAFGNDLEKINGNAEWELPVPATFLVDARGVVREVYFEADYRKRLEPETALEWVAKL